MISTKSIIRKMTGVICALLLTGCADQPVKETEAESESASEIVSEEMVSEEMASEEMTAEEFETETDFFGEVQMRSIWEVVPEQVRSWAESFSVFEVDHLVYTTYMEDEPDSYEVYDRETIRAVFDAVSQIQAGGSLGAARALGDRISFVMKDGTEVVFSFSASSLVLDDMLYETSQTEQLWDLTGVILFGEEPDSEE